VFPSAAPRRFQAMRRIATQSEIAARRREPQYELNLGLRDRRAVLGHGHRRLSSPFIKTWIPTHGPAALRSNRALSSSGVQTNYLIRPIIMRFD